MTREEAIICLQGLLDNPLINKGSYLAQAIEMAIQALSQEPCRYWLNGKCNGCTEVCEDTISRDMALEKMADYVASGYADSAEDFEKYSRIICQLPPVTPQNHGKMLVCPSCGLDVHSDFKYCPRCGRKMQESEKV